MSARSLPAALAAVGGALCVAEVVSFVQLSQRGGPDNVPVFALAFAALFALGAWLLRSGRAATGAILVGVLAAFEVVDYPSWAKHGTFDRVFDTIIAVVSLVGVGLAIAVLATCRTSRLSSGQAARR